MECRELFARLSEYLDGEMPPEACEALRAHLDGCRPCEAFARTLRLTIDLCRRLPGTPLPPRLRDELRARLARAR